MKKKALFSLGLLTSLLFVTAAVFSGAAIADKGKSKGFKPFETVATVSAYKQKGKVEHEDTYLQAQEVATAIATYIANKDEAVELGTDVIQGGNWILGGIESIPATAEEIEAAILRIPTNDPIDPSEPLSPENTKKVNVMDVCNPTFASKALGVKPIIEGDDDAYDDDGSSYDDESSEDLYVTNGVIHATALPCEIVVYNDEKKILVEMLNPEAIFSLFFTDVLFSEQMDDPDFAAEMQALPAQVRSELHAIIYAALDEAGYKYKATVNPNGPQYKSIEDVIEVLEETEYQSPYVHFTYTKPDETLFTQDDVDNVAQAIICTATINGEPGAGTHEWASDVPEDEWYLSPGSAWRSARPTPLPMPGGNRVIEMCSPKYAKMALDTGLNHAPALPCEIQVNKIEEGTKLFVTYLNPHFMFNALFSDAFNKMTDEELEAFAELTADVLADLQTIVGYTVEVTLVVGLPVDPPPAEVCKELFSMGLSEPVQVYYDMLPPE